MPTVHFSGNWYNQDTGHDMLDMLRRAGYSVLVDWTTPEHQHKPKAEQYEAIVDAINACDVVLISLEGMADRMWSATTAQLYMALGIKHKNIIVYDPDMPTRDKANSCGMNLHPSMVHLMGHALCCAHKVYVPTDMAMLRARLSQYTL